MPIYLYSGISTVLLHPLGRPNYRLWQKKASASSAIKTVLQLDVGRIMSGRGPTGKASIL